MKKLIVSITLCLIATLAVSVFGEDANKPSPPPAEEKVTVTGFVSAAKDKDGNLMEVMLSNKVVEYNVVLDEKGKELGALKGKEVKVVGTVKIENQAKWLTVISFEEVAPAPPEEAPAPPKEAPKQ